MGDSREMLKDVHQVLVNRPFAPILRNSKEASNLCAMKFMCVIDYYAEKYGIYEEIKDHPKMVQHLMQFHSYGSFKYYDCRIGYGLEDVENLILQCSFCEFIGTYSITICHIAINHNTHISLKQCAYCKRCDLSSHIDNKSLTTCYQSYLKKFAIEMISENIMMVTRNFYKFLKLLAENLDVLISRIGSYSGIGFQKIERIATAIEDFPSTCTVFLPKGSSKTIRPDVLNTFFIHAFQTLHGRKPIGATTIETTTNSFQQQTYESDRVTRNQIECDQTDERDMDDSQPLAYTPRTAATVATENHSVRKSFRHRHNQANGVAPQKTQSTQTDEDLYGSQSRKRSKSASFAQYVADRISYMTDDIKRRQLEARIQICIAEVELEAIQGN